MIVRKGPRKFQLLSRSTGRVLGTHPSYNAALRQERAIKASQARAARGVRSNPEGSNIPWGWIAAGGAVVAGFWLYKYGSAMAGVLGNRP